MDKDEIKKIINDHTKEICHYSQMQVFATSYYQSNFFQKQIDDVRDRLVYFCLELHPTTELQDQQLNSQPEALSAEEQMQLPEGEQSDQQSNAASQGQGEGEPQPPAGERTFTLEELEFYDGKNGRPAYVAVNGNVYDVSMLMRWAGGTHFGLYAGRDLSGVFMGCHQGRLEMLKNAPRIGVIRD